jgi:hypothetical protein
LFICFISRISISSSYLTEDNTRTPNCSAMRCAYTKFSPISCPTLSSLRIMAASPLPFLSPIPPRLSLFSRNLGKRKREREEESWRLITKLFFSGIGNHEEAQNSPRHPSLSLSSSSSSSSSPALTSSTSSPSISPSLISPPLYSSILPSASSAANSPNLPAIQIPTIPGTPRQDAIRSPKEEIATPRSECSSPTQNPETLNRAFTLCLLKIVVQDTGIGMSQEEQARIFKRFSQANNRTAHVSLRVRKRGGREKGGMRMKRRGGGRAIH